MFFGESGAQTHQLDVALFSHFHVDYSSDFPVLISSSWFEDRKRTLPVLGPPVNAFVSSTSELVHDLFSDPYGAWRYLSELTDPGTGGSYQLRPRSVIAGSSPVLVLRSGNMTIHAVRVIHGVFPSLAWRVEIGGSSIVFSGDTNGAGDGLTRLAMNVDVFVAHNAVPEGASGVERRLHMPPSVIGVTAGNAHARSLVLSHRMLRTLGREAETETAIRLRYAGPIVFANDLDCIPIAPPALRP